MKIYYALAAAALSATPAWAANSVTHANAGVQRGSETGLEADARVKGGSRTGGADASASTTAATSDDADMATDTRITATGRGSTYEGSENRHKGQGKKLGHERQENRTN